MTVDPNTRMGCVMGLAAAMVGSLIGTVGAALFIVWLLARLRESVPA